MRSTPLQRKTPLRRRRAPQDRTAQALGRQLADLLAAPPPADEATPVRMVRAADLLQGRAAGELLLTEYFVGGVP